MELICAFDYFSLYDRSEMRAMFGQTPPSPAAEPLSPSAIQSVGSTVLHQSSGTPSRTADEKRYKFLRRFIHFRHMDFEYALWQMLHLFISPQKVYVYKIKNAVKKVII